MQATKSAAATRIRTVEIGAHVGEEVRFMGWLHNVRRMGGVNFVILRDGWGTVQAVADDESALAPLRTSELSNESVIVLTGQVVSEAQAPGGFEVHHPQIELITPVREPLPVVISKRELSASLPNLLDHAAVVNRHPARRAIFRLSAGVMAAFRATLSARAFTEVQTPKIVASATESGANVFQIDYFGSPAYLAQSPQFYKQVMVGVFERVFEVSPVFRAEPHDTTRHVNEYVSLDVEFGFIDNHFTVMALLRDVLLGIFTTLASTYAADLELLNARVPVAPAAIPHLHFAEAKELVFHLLGGDAAHDERGEPDLSPQEERRLGEWAQTEHGSDFLFVTGYPMSKRPFYTHPDPARPGYSNSFDLLFRGTELVTGGQRLHRYDDYVAALARAGMPTAPFEAYLEAFRYGMPPHGGFAIGLERLLMQLLGLPNVRQTTLFPRDLRRLTP